MIQLGPLFADCFLKTTTTTTITTRIRKRDRDDGQLQSGGLHRMRDVSRDKLEQLHLRPTLHVAHRVGHVRSSAAL